MWLGQRDGKGTGGAAGLTVTAAEGVGLAWPPPCVVGAMLLPLAALWSCENTRREGARVKALLGGSKRRGVCVVKSAGRGYAAASHAAVRK